VKQSYRWVRLRHDFAAKEALTKALNIKTLNWREIEVANEESGKPYFKFHGQIVEKMNGKRLI
jgi:phosphopantetheinyl transferase (holo-ACP synthase)